MCFRFNKGEPRDRHRRCTSSHMAASRSSLAGRADAAAHLRSLRGDPPRLSDRRISAGPRRKRRHQVGLRPDQLAQRAVRGGDRLGATHLRGNGLAARNRRLRRFRRRRYPPATRPAEELQAGSWRAHAVALAREPAVPLCPARRSVRLSDDPPQRRAAGRLRLDLRSAGVLAADAGRGRPCRGLSKGNIHIAARRNAGRPVSCRTRGLARRHGAAGSMSECRLQTLGARYVHSSQRSRPHRRDRRRFRGNLRSRALHVRFQFSNRKVVDQLSRSRRGLSRRGQAKPRTSRSNHARYGNAGLSSRALAALGKNKQGVGEINMALEIKILDYGDIELESSFLVLGRDCGRTRRVLTLGFLITGGTYPIVVDTGYRSNQIMETLGMRGLQFHENMIENQLARHGVRMGDVRFVCHTHLHIDHAGKDDLFPMNTTVVVNRKELEYSVSGLMHPQYPAPDIKHLIDRLHTKSALRFLDLEVTGPVELIPGVYCEAANAHTEGSMNVHVHTAEGIATITTPSRAPPATTALRSGRKRPPSRSSSTARAFCCRCMTAPARSRAAMSSGGCRTRCRARSSSRCPSATGSRPEPGEGAAP